MPSVSNGRLREHFTHLREIHAVSRLLVMGRIGCNWLS